MGSEVQSREGHLKISNEIEDNNYFWFGSTNTSQSGKKNSNFSSFQGHLVAYITRVVTFLMV